MCDFLLVEDEAGVAKVYEALLRGEAGKIGWACKITTCHSLTEAERLASLHTYEAVLLDLHLPDSNSEETAAAIKRLSKIWPAIIVLTYNTKEDLRHDCLTNGAQDFITKSLMQAYPDIVLERIYNAKCRHERIP